VLLVNDVIGWILLNNGQKISSKNSAVIVSLFVASCYALWLHGYKQHRHAYSKKSNTSFAFWEIYAHLV